MEPMIKLTESEKNWLKDWWKNHWDEVMLVSGLTLAGFFFAIARGWL